MDNNQNQNYSRGSSDLLNKTKNTAYENAGINQNSALNPGRKADHNTDSEDFYDPTNPLYNPDKDFEEDIDMDDAFLDDEEENEISND